MAKTCDKCGSPSRRFIKNFDIRYCFRCWRQKDDEFGKRVSCVGSLRFVDGTFGGGVVWNDAEDMPSMD